MNNKNDILYERWKNMRKRCYCRKDKDYRHYGLRGIIVCDEWSRFSVFKMWFEEVYSMLPDELKAMQKSKIVIDRIDAKGNYEPSNCRLITNSENSKRVIKRRDKYGRFVGLIVGI